MRDGDFGLDWIFRITTVWSMLFAASRIFGFESVFIGLGGLFGVGCVWYVAMLRAPTPTLYFTIAFFFFAPVVTLLMVNLVRHRESARNAQSIHSLKEAGSARMLEAQFYPDEFHRHDRD
jgi:hypothetical protein